MCSSRYEMDHSPSALCPCPFGTVRRARTLMMPECRMADFALGSFVRVASTPPGCLVMETVLFQPPPVMQMLCQDKIKWLLELSFVC